MSESAAELPFGRFLKFWRGVHSLSQEELAHRLDSSTRHLSRLENGSSRPSETMAQDIAQALNLGQRDRNYLMLSAGYTTIEEKRDFHGPQLKWLRKAMVLTLRSLDPYPAALTDGLGNLLMVNRGWVGFYLNSNSGRSLDDVTNLYDFMFSRQGAGNIISGWEDTLSVIMMSLKQGIMLGGNDGDGQTLLDRLEVHPSIPDDWAQRAAILEPMASFKVQVEIDGALKRFYSVAQTVGALGPAAYVSEPQLSINTLYPEDDTLDLSPLIAGDLSHPLLPY
ncbi:MAG: helix-turn-helix domain-containing protein [Oceanicoccus sp.]